MTTGPPRKAVRRSKRCRHATPRASSRLARSTQRGLTNGEARKYALGCRNGRALRQEPGAVIGYQTVHTPRVPFVDSPGDVSRSTSHRRPHRPLGRRGTRRNALLRGIRSEATAGRVRATRGADKSSSRLKLSGPDRKFGQLTGRSYVPCGESLSRWQERVPIRSS